MQPAPAPPPPPPPEAGGGFVGGRAEAPAAGPAGGAIAGPSGCAGGACLVKRPSSRIETSDGIQIGTRIIRRGAGSRPVGFDYPQFIFFTGVEFVRPDVTDLTCGR